MTNLSSHMICSMSHMTNLSSHMICSMSHMTSPKHHLIQTNQDRQYTEMTDRTHQRVMMSYDIGHKFSQSF